MGSQKRRPPKQYREAAKTKREATKLKPEALPAAWKALNTVRGLDLKKATIAQVTDLHFDIEEELTKLNLKITELKAERTKLAEKAIEILDEQDNEVSRGGVADGKITKHDHYNISNGDALDRWILATRHVEVLERRVAKKAYRELRDLGITPPGISIFTKREFSTTKRKQK